MIEFKKKEFVSKDLKVVYQDLVNLIEELQETANNFPTDLDVKELKEYTKKLNDKEKDFGNIISTIKFLRDEQEMRNFKDGIDKLFQKAFMYLASLNK